MAEKFKGKAYVKEGCPFSCKFLVFMAEAGLLDEIEVVRCDPASPLFEEERFRLQTWLGNDAAFPAVEIEPGVYEADSDRLIDYYAQKHGISRESMPVLAFYEQTILPDIHKIVPKMKELYQIKHSAEE